MESLFLIVPAFACVIFVVVFAVILATFAKGFGEWADNNRRPVETVYATVVAKRTNVSGMSGSSTSTSYFCTFELENGDRREFAMSGERYGLVAEGDAGMLTFQGSRYHGFQRQVA